MINKCPICQSNNVSSLDFGGYRYQGKEFDLVKCFDCRLMFLSPMPDEAFLTQLYQEEEYFEKDYGGGVNVNYKESYFFNLKKYKEIINRIKKYKKDGYLLEIGCAGGYFLKTAQEAGFKVEGIEVSSHLADFGRKELKLDIKTGKIEDFDLPKNFYDVIYLGDVLEHIYSINDFMQKVNRILKPDGLLYIDLPATYNYTLLGLLMSPFIFLKNLSLSKKYFLFKERRIKKPKNPPYHLYEFIPNSVKVLIKKHGFQITKLITHDGWPKGKDYKSLKSKIISFLKKVTYFITKIFYFMGLGDRISVLSVKKKNN